MNIKAKSGLIIILSLLIGMVLGVLIDRTWIHQTFERRIERFRAPGGFAFLIERIIEPTPAQKEQIKKIMENHLEKMNEYRRRSRSEMKALMDSLRIELEPVLTAEQKEKLKNSLKSMERRPFGGRGKRSGRHFDRDEPPPPPDLEKESPFLP